jgi:hypothetical protein
MAIEDRNLKAGTKLVARYKGKEHGCTVMEGDDKGGRRFMLDDDRVFKSPSAAGSAVMGGITCNGWRFWSLEGSEEVKPKRAAKKAKANGNAGFKRLEDGRYWCETCVDAFDAPKNVTPVGCPKGHSPDGKVAKEPKPKKEAVTA